MGQTHYLATTGISEIWDLESDKILFLGPWCLVDEKNKQLLGYHDFSVVTSPWRPASSIKGAADYCHDLYERILADLADSLNGIHRISLPLKSWQVLLGFWLLHYVGILYDRYVRIENVVRLSPDFYTHTLAQDDCGLESLSTYDFFSNKVDNDFYNLKLFSVIIKALVPEKGIAIEYQGKMRTGDSGCSWKRRVFYGCLNAFDGFLKNPVVLSDMYQLTPKDILLLKLRGGMRVVSPMDFPSVRQPLTPQDVSLRDGIRIDCGKGRFEQLLARVIPRALPICYVENFDFNRESVSGMRLRKLVASSVGWYFNERFKFFAAMSGERGAEFLDFQHGGAYGTSLSVPHEQLSLSCDTYYTWGWDTKEFPNAKPFPNARLSKLIDSHKLADDKLLIVGMSTLRYVYMLQCNLQPDDMDGYHRDMVRFIEGLSERIKSRVLYRPYRDYGWGETRIVRSICPGARMIGEGNLCDWMQKVKVVFIDHPHTSFLEALIINVPCVLYWDSRIFAMRPEARDYFDKLRRAGILFDSPVDASRKVNEVYDDALLWWKSSEIQDARRVFCNRFAYARRDWMKVWIDEFGRLGRR